MPSFVRLLIYPGRIPKFNRCVVSTDQAASGHEHRAGRVDAADGHDHVADVDDAGSLAAGKCQRGSRGRGGAAEGSSTAGPANRVVGLSAGPRPVPKVPVPLLC